ncbi:MAG TPA: metal ABC transporter substrate-binding protein [Limnochorda sp.]
MWRLVAWVGLISLVLGLGAGAVLAQAPLQVVATLAPIADLAAQLGGSRVTVTALLPPGASPHGYEPRPSDLRAIARARLVISVGAGLDTWLQPLLAVAREARHLELAWTTALLPGHTGEPEAHGETPPQHGGGHASVETASHGADDHDHGPWDPHVWLDPIRVRDDLLPAMAQELAALDPAGAEAYRANLAALQARLTELDEEVRQLLAPYAGTRFVAVHSAWRYFAARYGLEQVGSLQEFPGREPGPAWMAALIRLAREAGVRVVVTEAQFDPRLAQQVAREIGVPVVPLDPLGGPGVVGMESYVAMIRANAARLREALDGRNGR